jgi:hypothetical protein
MAFQGEYFSDRYGKGAAAHTPPVKRMLQAGVPVGAGTDATRVSSYNPWVALYWLSVGKTVGGLQLYGDANRLSRETALELYTKGSAWFSNEQHTKGAIKAGQLADLAVLDADYFEVQDEAIKSIESVLTIVGGKIVYAKEEFASYAPPSIPVLPDWSPVKQYGGYYSATQKGLIDASSAVTAQVHCCAGSCTIHGHDHNQARFSPIPVNNYSAFWGAFGCSCFAF